MAKRIMWASTIFYGAYGAYEGILMISETKKAAIEFAKERKNECVAKHKKAPKNYSEGRICVARIPVGKKFSLTECRVWDSSNQKTAKANGW